MNKWLETNQKETAKTDDLFWRFLLVWGSLVVGDYILLRYYPNQFLLWFGILLVLIYAIVIVLLLTIRVSLYLSSISSEKSVVREVLIAIIAGIASALLVTYGDALRQFFLAHPFGL